MSLPYFGAAKGHVLQITRGTDGIVSTKVIQQQQSSNKNDENRPSAAVSPSASPSAGSTFIYGELADIQKATADILSLQERIRLNERLTKFDHQLYMDQLKKLNEAGAMVVSGAEQSSQNGMHDAYISFS